MPELVGDVAPGFEQVADVFAENFAVRGDTGAGVCVYHDGRRVVDLVAGAVGPDSLQLVRSVGKGVLAVLVHLLHAEGVIDIHAPIATVWPEFAVRGKEDIPLAAVLSHQAGMPAVRSPVTRADAYAWHPVVAALAAQEPYWAPGTRHGYHDLTFGWLIGETLRRATGHSVGELVDRHLARPLGLDLWIGLPAEEFGRVVELRPPVTESDEELTGPGAALRDALADPDSLVSQVVLNPNLEGVEHDPAYLAAEVPSANCVTDARSLARLYAATVSDVDGHRLLGPDAVRVASTLRADGIDEVTGFYRRYGLGFMLPEETRPMAGTDTACFGHYGQGGSVGFADPELRVGFGFTTVQDHPHHIADMRSHLLAKAAWECVR